MRRLHRTRKALDRMDDFQYEDYFDDSSATWRQKAKQLDSRRLRNLQRAIKQGRHPLQGGQ